MKKILLFASAIGSMWLYSCKGDSKNTEHTTITTPPSVITAKAPVFSADSAYAFVEKQVAFGPRVPNSSAHRKCGDYLIAQLKAYGGSVTAQDFTTTAYDGTKLSARNIIAAFNPQASKRILLAAHWDTRPFADKDTIKVKQPIDGANDGASGVGVLLEVARILATATEKPAVGIDIIFFDVEDYGIPEFAKDGEFPSDPNMYSYYCLGSRYWGQNLHKPGYSAYYGILLDMTGGKNATFYKEQTSMEVAPSIMNKVWEIGQALGYGQYFQNIPVSGIIDDHVLVSNYTKIPMIDIIAMSRDGYFGDYHHTHADNMDIIDKNTLKAVGQTVLQTIYQE